MKMRLVFAYSVVALLLALPVCAQEKKEPAKDAVTIPADYPMATCLVTDEKFGEHGEPAVAHTHRVAGKPDRVVYLCCEHCVNDFNGDPARYLKKLDEAAAAHARGAGAQKEAPKSKKEEAPPHKH